MTTVAKTVSTPTGYDQHTRQTPAGARQLADHGFLREHVLVETPAVTIGRDEHPTDIVRVWSSDSCGWANTVDLTPDAAEALAALLIEQAAEARLRDRQRRSLRAATPLSPEAHDRAAEALR